MKELQKPLCKHGASSCGNSLIYQLLHPLLHSNPDIVYWNYVFSCSSLRGLKSWKTLGNIQENRSYGRWRPLGLAQVADSRDVAYHGNGAVASAECHQLSWHDRVVITCEICAQHKQHIGLTITSHTSSLVDCVNTSNCCHYFTFMPILPLLSKKDLKWLNAKPKKFNKIRGK
jgi:hypothetical protein